MRLRAQVHKSADFNFQSDVRFSSIDWLCECKKAIQSQRHLKVCTLYSEIQEKYPLESDIGLARYFDEILQRRNANQ